MRTAYVLYIADETVGPCLRLLRCVCDPQSRSVPHVTVRYPIDRLQGNDLTAYRNLTVDEIDVVEPGGFNLEDTGITNGSRTVFVRCTSDSLEALSYKPDFPDSVFHITIYEGESLEFGRQLLSVLQRFPWRFKVPLPKLTRLTEIEIGGQKKDGRGPPRLFTPELKSLFHQITSEHLTHALLASLPDSRRLELSEAICAYLHRVTAGFARAASRPLIPATEGRAPADVFRDRIDSRTKGLADRLGDDYEHFVKSLLYLTPPELAGDIARFTVSNLRPDITVDFGDPAVGTGVFFSSLIGVLPEQRIRSAIGIDIDAARVEETRQRWSHRGLVVERGDYLHMDNLPRRTLIMANPPYVRYQEVPTAYRERLQERASAQTGMQISGQSSLYVYFLLLSHAWMQDEAIASWLIPSEFMETNYGAVVRRYLTEKVQPIRIHRFRPDRTQFENALVTSAVVVFRNSTPDPGQDLTLSSGASLMKPEYSERVKLSELRQETKWKVPWVRLHVRSSSQPRIGDLFNVTRGLATGANAFFVMERTSAARIGIPETALRPILPKARTLKKDIVERDNDGYPRTSPQLCVIDCDLSEDEIARRHPRFFDYLRTVPDAVLQSRLVRARHPWYRQERRRPAPFLCTYMGRGSKNNLPLRFLWNKSDAIATNTYLMLYPRQGLSLLIEQHPEALETLFEVLKGTSADLVASDRVYGGGLHKIEPRELLNVRLSCLPLSLYESIRQYLPLI